jgi:hypothetical protein
MVHAFTHSLSTILDFLRNTLARPPLSDDLYYNKSKTLATIWMHYAEVEDILRVLSILCNRVRSNNRVPINYVHTSEAVHCRRKKRHPLPILC